MEEEEEEKEGPDQRLGEGLDEGAEEEDRRIVDLEVGWEGIILSPRKRW